MDKELIAIAMDMAFEAGRWLGQVDLETHYDNEQYSQVMAEVFISRKTSMPIEKASQEKTVHVNLRSKKWRESVYISSNQYLRKAKEILINNG